MKPFRLSSRRAAWARAALFGSLTALIATSACSDPFAPRATTTVRSDSFVVYAVSETPVNVPSAFNIVFFTPLRLEPNYGYDLVFDIDAQGRAVIIPVRLVGGAVTAGRIVGLQRVAGNYDEMTRAPASGYQYDSTLALGVGEGALVELYADQCQYQASRVVYSKLRILAVDVPRRILAFEITYDPNCGFRSFLPGVPTD